MSKIGKVKTSLCIQRLQDEVMFMSGQNCECSRTNYVAKDALLNNHDFLLS